VPDAYQMQIEIQNKSSDTSYNAVFDQDLNILIFWIESYCGDLVSGVDDMDLLTDRAGGRSVADLMRSWSCISGAPAKSRIALDDVKSFLKELDMTDVRINSDGDFFVDKSSETEKQQQTGNDDRRSQQIFSIGQQEQNTCLQQPDTERSSGKGGKHHQAIEKSVS
jgi:hypothetical protein